MTAERTMVLDPRIGEALLEAYVRLTADGSRVLELNGEAADIFGVEPEVAMESSISELLGLKEEKWPPLLERLKQGPCDCLIDTSQRRFLFSAVQLEDGLLLFFLETTYWRKAEEALRIHEVLFDNAQDIILYVDQAGRVVNANEKACAAYGWSKEELLQLRIQEIRYPSTLDAFAGQMACADAGGIVFESIHVRRDGTSFPVEVSARSTETRDGRLRIHIIRDITERKEQEAKIAYLARYDGLTGVLNRVSFIGEMEEEIQRAQRYQTKFALLLFDLDKFKAVNDQFGHTVGDEVLREVACRIKGELRSIDRIGRFGGDEFVILQTAIEGREDVLALVQRINEALQHYLRSTGGKFKLSISVGASLFPDDAETTGDLLLFADQAMYETKRRGGSGISFYQPLPS